MMLLIFFKLLIGHALADFPLQGDFLARGKNRHSVNMPPPGAKPGAIWPYCLTAHSLIHAGTVWIITGSVELALIECVAHWVIDFAKCENDITLHQDQFLHVLCKLFYAFAIAYGK
jgi:hypothetical protein